MPSPGGVIGRGETAHYSPCGFSPFPAGRFLCPTPPVFGMFVRVASGHLPNAQSVAPGPRGRALRLCFFPCL